MPPSAFFFKLSPLRLSVLLSIVAFAVAAFALSALGEVHLQGGPMEDRTKVEYVLKNDVRVQLGNVDKEAPDWQPLSADVPLEAGVSFSTGDSSELGIFFLASDVIRLFPNTEVAFEHVDFSEYPFVLKFSVLSGSVWVSDLQGTVDVVISTPRLQISPEYASAFIHYEQPKTQIFAAHHPVRVSFLDDSPDREILNDYLLTESHQAHIQEDLLTPRLSELRYTKLTKEYPFTYIGFDQWEAEWKIAFDGDLNRLSQLRTDFIALLRRQDYGGAPSGSFKALLEDYYKKIRSILTFDKSHLIELQEDEDLEVLYRALSLIAQREVAEGTKVLNDFDSQSSSLNRVEKLDPLTHFFHSIAWGDDFYPAKEKVRSLILDSAPEERRISISLLFLRERLNEVYDLLDRGAVADAKNALLTYNQEWKSFIATEKNRLVDQVKRLTEERQILQNLLFREDAFYQVPPYDVLTVLEESILTLTPAEYDLNEERQAFIQDNILVLKRLVMLIDEKNVSIEEGSRLAYRLISQSQNMLRNITSETAVVDYFSSALNELNLQIQFIHSPDYALAQGTFQEKFQSYLDKEQDLAELTAYIRSLSDAQNIASSLTLEEAQLEAETAFRIEGIDFISLLSLGDQDYRLFSIEGGRVGTTDLQGNYDRGTGIVYDLKIEGEALSSGIRLDNLTEAVDDFLSSGEQPVSSGEESDGEPNVESESSSDLSSTEQLAIDLAVESLQEAGLEVSEEDVQVQDLEANLFSVRTFFDYGSDFIQVDFRYNPEEPLAFDVLTRMDDLSLVVDDVLVEDLEDAVLEAWRADDL